MGGFGRTSPEDASTSQGAKMLYDEDSSSRKFQKSRSLGRAVEGAPENGPLPSCRGTLLGDTKAREDTRVDVLEEQQETTPETGGYEEGAGQAEGEARSEDVSGSVGSSSGHYDPKQDVILRLEYISAGEHKAVICMMWSAVAVGIAFLLMQFIFKFRSDMNKLPGRYVFMLNLAIGGVLFAVLTLVGGNMLLRIMKVNREKRIWKHRRTRAAILYGTECFLQWINVIFFLVPNINVLVHRCEGVTRLVAWCAIVRWTCWNTTFFLFCIHARSAHPLQRGGGAGKLRIGRRAQRMRDSGPGPPHGKIVMDAPLWVHWKLAPLWLLLEGLTFWAAFQWAYSDWSAQVYQPPGVIDCWQWHFDCSEPPIILATSIAMDVVSFLYFVMYIWLIWAAVHHLRKVPYHENKMGNLIVQMQLRMRSFTMLMFTLTVTLLWFVRTASCRSYVYIWYGMLPVQIVQTGAAVAYAIFSTPKDPDAELPVLRVWLQEFAWVEEELPRRIKERNQSAPDCSQLAREPMFCFETMMICLYWSCLVYDYEEVEDSNYTLESAMSLYGLEHHELFWEKAMDTKMILAWSKHTIMIAFRGTASMQNALADLRAWRTIHPPSRGHFHSRPLVHEGFLKSWHANGLAQRVVERVRTILKGNDIDFAHARVIVTGHSLGGALACLAAYDIRGCALALGINLRLTVYTFGQPRVGNHAFAKDFTQMVPDSWSIVNDQDIVARGAKFLIMYKRGGQRVILNRHGDMIVRPTAIEISMQLKPGGGSVSQHYLGSYQRSILSVLLHQFSRKAFKGGLSGVHRLAQKSEPVQRLLWEGAGVSVADIKRLERWGPMYAKRIASVTNPEVVMQLKGKKKLPSTASGSISASGKSSLRSQSSGAEGADSSGLPLKSLEAFPIEEGEDGASYANGKVIESEMEAGLAKLDEEAKLADGSEEPPSPQ